MGRAVARRGRAYTVHGPYHRLARLRLEIVGQNESGKAATTREYPDKLFIAYLLSRNVRIEEDLVDQLFNSSEERLARILLLLAHFGKESRPESVIPKVSQETLAAMVGTTRSRVSYFMNRFRKMGFMHYNGGLQVNTALLTAVLRD
jgi:hypothetical protein